MLLKTLNPRLCSSPLAKGYRQNNQFLYRNLPYYLGCFFRASVRFSMPDTKTMGQDQWQMC